MAWMIRWAAELISKYAVGEDGKTPYERFRQEDCVTPLVAFGEIVMYLPLKIVHRNKVAPATKSGIWLGVSERTEEVLTSIKKGVGKMQDNCKIGRQREVEQTQHIGDGRHAMGTNIWKGRPTYLCRYCREWRLSRIRE